MSSDVPVDLDNILCLTLDEGVIVIELLPNAAPNHVARIKELVQNGFYNGMGFHRADDRMVQTGDPSGKGNGSSGQTISAEFSNLNHVKDTVSMARYPDDPDSADCQWFIVRRDQPDFDGKFTVWGRVISGMDIVGQIQNGTLEKTFTVGREPVTVGGYIDPPHPIWSTCIGGDFAP